MGKIIRDETLFLCYHAVSREWESPISVSPERLMEHLGRLKQRGFESVGFTEAATQRKAGRRVAITFDDGCRSVYETARPILEEFGMTATLFVPTGYLGRTEPMSWPGIEDWASGAHADELIPMSWDEARRLAESGWEIGSHTLTHPRLPRLTESELIEELAASRAECEKRLGRACTSIAYPYGDVDDRVAAAAGQVGYLAGAALMYSEAKETPLARRRVGIHEPDGPLAFGLKTSRIVNRVWRSPAWTAIGWVIGRLRG